MATVAASAVTVLETWYCEGPSGRKLKAVRATIVLSSQGSDTNPIPATVFGLRTIEKSSSLIQDDNSNIYATGRSFDGTKLYVIGSSHAPGDITGTYKTVVTGKY